MRSLLLLLLPLCFAGSPFARADEAPSSSAKWEKEIVAYEAVDQKSPPPKGAIVFVGSSSIRLWKTLAQDFPRHRVINRGFGGSEMADSAHFAERLVLAHQPRLIVVYAGGNDINSGKSPEQVFAAFKAFVAKVRAAQPETPIAYISIAGNPRRWAQVEKVKAANGLVAAYCKEQPHLQFIDVFPEMLAADGLPKPEIFVEDRLHMNTEGYKIWTRVVGSFLPEPDLK